MQLNFPFPLRKPLSRISLAQNLAIAILVLDGGIGVHDLVLGFLPCPAYDSSNEKNLHLRLNEFYTKNGVLTRMVVYSQKIRK